MKDKIQTSLAIMISSFLALLMSIGVVWLCTLLWAFFPVSVKVFLMLVTGFISYIAVYSTIKFSNWLNYWSKKTEAYFPTEDGMYLISEQKVKAYPSLRSSNPMKMLGETKVEQIEVPRLGVLVRDNMLINDKGEVLLGYRKNGTARYGNWPKVFAMLGIGNSGKSVTMFLFIVIALFMGYEVVVCDPHSSKERSIYKKLISLEQYIKFAFTTKEIETELIQHSQELAMKKDNQLMKKKLLVIDELASLVKRTPAIAKLLVQVVEESSQEGMGYDHNLMLACHGMKQDTIGDVSIRAALNGVFCHRVDSEESKHVLKERKFYTTTAKLPSGHVLYRDEYSEIEYLIMPFGDNEDNKDVLEGLRNNDVMPTRTVISSVHSTPSLANPLHRSLAPVNGYVNTVNAVNTLDKLMETNDSIYTEEENSELAIDKAPVNGVDVNGLNLKTLIIRMRKQGISHGKISASIGMNGRRYTEYKHFCIENSISLDAIEKE